jgi:hypothetical protein
VIMEKQEIVSSGVTKSRIAPIESIVLYNPLSWNYPGLITVNFTYKLSYSSIEYNYMHVYTPNSYTKYNIKGKVCSITQDTTNEMFYLAMCGVPTIFYFDRQTSKMGILIGNSTSGYQEGMKNDALFEDEIYVSYYNRRVLVLDTLNCVLRDVVIGADGPGDFRTKSYYIYGTVQNNQPLCVALVQPRYFFPLSNFIIAFVHDTKRLCQYHFVLRKIVCMKDFVVPTELYGVSITQDGKQLSFTKPVG